MAKVGAALAALSRTEWAVIGVAGAVLVGAGAMVGPRLLLGATPQPAELTLSEHVTDVERAFALQFESLLKSCRGLLHSTDEGADRMALALWKDDRVDRGAINRGEVLIIAHNPVMLTLETMESDVDGDQATAGPPVSYDALFSDRLSDIWRALPDCETHVIATSVAGIRFATTPGADGFSRLEVRLIWDQTTSDEPHEALFSVELPSVQRSGRGD